MANIYTTYIHIPFCSSICSYCDFCKLLYNEELINKYLKSLKKEIKTKYKKETLKTLYVGGGTPSCLSINELKELFNIIKSLKLDIDYEFTIEANINDIIEEKLELFKQNGINRLSIGIETINKKHLNFLNRNHTKKKVIEKINLAKQYFDNINIDLMYAFPNQTIEELNKDLDFIKKINVNHISIYSLIIEEHTKIYIDKIEALNDALEEKMYYHIIKYLRNLGYNHYEVSNFAKPDYESKHNLVYWNNKEYYGFGLGASGYINDVRYTNTRSLNNYLDSCFTIDKCIIDKAIKMENHMILGLRKIEGVSKSEFKETYGLDIEEVFDIIDLVDKKLIINDDKYISIAPHMLYLQNSILINFIKGVGND